MNEQEQPEPLEVYTNSVRLSANIYEFVFQLGLTTPGEETRELLRVRMSPQHAMALHHLLEANLRAYEDQFAEVFLPDDLVRQLADYEQAGKTDQETE